MFRLPSVFAIPRFSLHATREFCAAPSRFRRAARDFHVFAARSISPLDTAGIFLSSDFHAFLDFRPFVTRSSGASGERVRSGADFHAFSDFQPFVAPDSPASDESGGDSDSYATASARMGNA